MERLTERLTDKSYCISDIRAIQKETFYEDMECRSGFDLYTGKAIDKLAEYEDLEEQNRLIKLPCAVGDTVYTLNPLLNGKTVIGETTADAFFCALVMLEGRFGKTVFLTREESEAALKELERSKGE